MHTIVFIIAELNVGGAETMLFELAKRLDRNLFNITVLSLQDKGYFGQLLENEKINVVTLNMKNKWDIFKFKNIHPFFKNNSFDIIHSFMFHSNILARCIAKIYKIPINISAVHTIEKGAQWHLLVDTITNHLVTNETVICKTAHDFMIQKTNIRPDKITVINNAVDERRFNQRNDSELIKRLYNIPPGVKIIGTVSSLTKVKGHIHLIKAARDVIKEIPNAVFVIIGEGPYRELLMNNVRKYNLDKYFFFLGFITPIHPLLSILDCFVLPSLWEGVPIALLEAMAAKKAVIASKTGGINDILKDGVSGLMVPVGDEIALSNAIVKILKDPALSKMMGQNAHKSISEGYTFDEMVHKTTMLYSELLQTVSIG